MTCLCDLTLQRRDFSDSCLAGATDLVEERPRDDGAEEHHDDLGRLEWRLVGWVVAQLLDSRVGTPRCLSRCLWRCLSARMRSTTAGSHKATAALARAAGCQARSRAWNRKKRCVTPKSISDRAVVPESRAMMRRMMGTMARKILSTRPGEIREMAPLKSHKRVGRPARAAAQATEAGEGRLVRKRARTAGRKAAPQRRLSSQ